MCLVKEGKRKRVAAGEDRTRKKQQCRVYRQLGKDTLVLFLEVCGSKCLID